jgi:plasmid stabilization system protein ParE
VTRHRVKLSSRATRHAEKITDWWHANRPAAPNLFDDELTKAIALVSLMPNAGEPYSCEVPNMRRLLMPYTGHWLYYSVRKDSLVWVHAIWHTARGKGPPLP